MAALERRRLITEQSQREDETMSPARRRWPRTVRRLAELLVVGFILEYFVVPQIGGTHKAIHVLQGRTRSSRWWA